MDNSVAKPVPFERYGLVDTGLSDERNIHEFLVAESAKWGQLYPGRNGQLVERVVPMATSSAHAASLSASYGLKALPFHIDTAHRVVPARLVFIACVEPGAQGVPTCLLDWQNVKLSHDKRALLKAATFLMRTGRRSFYSTILSDQRPFVRYDPGCMQPTDACGLEAMDLMTDVFAAETPVVIDWQPGRVLMFDNWRMLHARGDATASRERILLRSCVQ